jgi:hypothetical protein
MRAFFILQQAVSCTDIRLLSRHKGVFRYPLNLGMVSSICTRLAGAVFAARLGESA